MNTAGVFISRQKVFFILKLHFIVIFLPGLPGIRARNTRSPCIRGCTPVICRQGYAVLEEFEIVVLDAAGQGIPLIKMTTGNRQLVTVEGTVD
jgi:hypothetical protein